MFSDLAKSRFSSRKYLDKAVEKEKIIMVLEAARIAPTAANLQPFCFYVYQSPVELEKIRNVYHRAWYKEAPVVIVACADHSKSWVRASDKKDHADIDIAIAIDHLTLQAAELGLGTCWICNFDVIACREVLQLPNHIEPVALIPLAYPADKSDLNRFEGARKKLSDLVIWK